MTQEADRLFEERRPALEKLAYRMLGSLADAEDVVQDAWLRWRAAERADIDNPPAFLATIVTRLCLDQLKSGRARREDYVGVWLPDPIVEAEVVDPLEVADEVGVALMLVLERLSPLERAAFLLHDVFDMSFDAIAGVLGRSAASCRQLATRARAHVRAEKPRFSVPPEAGATIARAFRAAAGNGDIGAMQKLLADNAVLLSDGGGKRPAALNPIHGADHIARFFEGLHRKFGYADTGPVDVVRINGLPGYVTIEPRGVLQTTAFDIAEGRIAAIYVVRNPDKLGHLAT